MPDEIILILRQTERITSEDSELTTETKPEVVKVKTKSVPTPTKIDVVPE